MTKLSIDFAFEGFRIIRQRPGLILAWGLVLLIGNAVAWGCALPLAWPVLKPFTEGTPFPTDPMAIFAFVGSLILPLLVLLIITVIVRSIIDCAVMRLVLESPQKSFGYMRLGGDEFRIILFGIVMGLLLGVISFGISLVSGIIGGILTMALAKTNAAFVGSLVQLLLYYGAYYYICIRLSLSKAQTFRQKSLNFFGSWEVTNGHVLTLLLGYIVAGILMLVISILCVVIFALVVAIIVGTGAMSLAGLEHITPAALPALAVRFAPLLGAYVAFVSLIVSPLMIAIICGAPAAAYRDLSGTSTAKLDNIF
ncbi:MAG: hypothetical protein JF615_08260 [Asticcacaulis sp.]|nr:hypothetical protein [Asticcacaulis sp.]